MPPENVTHDPSLEDQNQDTRSSQSWTGSNSPDHMFQGDISSEVSTNAPPHPSHSQSGQNYCRW
jgi:hypothetical protein